MLCVLQSAVPDVATIPTTLPCDTGGSSFGLLLRFCQGCAHRRHAKYATTGRNQLISLETGAGMKDLATIA